MPEYPYPYAEPPPGWWTITLHVVLFCVFLIPFIGLFLQSRRQATSFDLYLWITLLVLAPLAFGLGIANVSESSRPFLVGLLVLTEVVCLLAIVITSVRMSRQGQAANAVVAICGLIGFIVLVILLLPSVPVARQAAWRSQCANNLKQLGVALHNYHAAFDLLPPPTTVAEHQIATSWRIVLAPYFDCGHITNQYDRSRPWDAQENHAVATSQCPVLTCPANPRPMDEQQRYFTAYALPVGPDAAVFGPHPLNATDLNKGSSHTLAIVEACGRNIVWTNPQDADTAILKYGVNRPGTAPHFSNGLLSSRHRDGAHAARLDGSVQYIHRDIDPNVLRALVSGNELEE